MAPRSALFVVLLFGCGGESPSTNEATEPQPRPTESTEEPTPETAPPATSPVTVRVVNDTDAAAVLDRSFGPADPLGVARLDEVLGAGVDLDQVDDPETGGWIGTCQCACGGGPCPECEPPGTVHVTLQPGDHYDFTWSGRLRRMEDHPEGGACWTAFDPPAGRYVFTACTTEDHCARAEQRLPANETIEIRLGQAAAAASCERVSAHAMRTTRDRLVRSLGGFLRDRPVAQCPETPICVAPTALDQAMNDARGDACTVFVIPRGDELETRAFLPLPEGWVGGESYAHFGDPDATQLFRARYEQ